LYHLEWGALDQAYEAPMNDDPRFLDWLADLCRKERIDFLHPQADRDVALLGKHRDALGVQMSLPSEQMIKDAQYKPKSASIWQKRGIRLDAPKMLLLPDDIAEAERRFGYPFWMRASRGAGASGSCKASNALEAFTWMTYWNATRPGNPTFGQEYLPGRNFAFHSVWNEGELICSGVRQRLEFVYPQHAPSGVTSSPVVARTVHNEEVNQMAVAAIMALDPSPHGIHSMDLQEDSEGVPRPTELNAGRFFNTSYYFTAAGANMPYMHIALALGLRVPVIPQFNAVPAGLYWLRHIDSERVLVKEGEWRGIPLREGDIEG